MLDRSSAEEILQSTIPPGNIVHGLERLLAKSIIQDHQFHVYMAQWLLGCPMNSAMMCAANCDSIPEVLNTARKSGIIDDRTRVIAIHAYYFLVDRIEVFRITFEENTGLDNFQGLATRIESRGLSNANIARIRRWKPVPRDEIQKIFDSGRSTSEQETRIEILIQRLMEKHWVDRADTMSAFRDSDLATNKAHNICASIARSLQGKSSQEIPILPTRDTCNPPKRPIMSVYQGLGTIQATTFRTMEFP